jgi:hypothetical protein
MLTWSAVIMGDALGSTQLVWGQLPAVLGPRSAVAVCTGVWLKPLLEHPMTM